MNNWRRKKKKMKSSSLVLISIAVLVVGIFALPTTISLFSGQHTWYGISGDNQLPCRKCHADVYDELQASAFHRWNNSDNGFGRGSGPQSNFACYGCHRANASITYADIGTDFTDVTKGKEAHAASTVACMLCHQFNASVRTGTMQGFPAGGFADPYAETGPYNYTKGTSTGGHAAHQKFIASTINMSAMEDSNEACIACHTHTPVNITWVHAHDLEFNATWKDISWNGTEEFPPTHFNVSDWDVNGTVTNQSYGNGSGSGSTGGWP